MLRGVPPLLLLAYATATAAQQEGSSDREKYLGPCTNAAQLQARLTDAASICCDEDSEVCKSGWPSSCNLGCAAVLVPLKEQCSSAMGRLAQYKDQLPKLEAAIASCPCQAEIAACSKQFNCQSPLMIVQRLPTKQLQGFFADSGAFDDSGWQIKALTACYAKTFNVDLSTNGGDNGGDGGDDGGGDGAIPPSGTAFCKAHSDCQTRKFCGVSQSPGPTGGELVCTDCATILPGDDCNAVDTDCCASTFLSACTSNPFHCAPRIECSTVQEYTAAMQKLAATCCPTPVRKGY